MSLARTFTKRFKRDDNSPSLSRHGAGTIKRSMISLPTELISTTNMQALTAPDIRSVSASTSASSDASSNLGNDSDFSTIDKSFLSNQDTDASSVEFSSPATPNTPHTESKSFFDAKQIDSSPLVFQAEATPDTPDVPMIPKRAPSHSKKAHVELSRKRSIQRMTPPPDSLEKTVVRNSADIFGTADSNAHPFGRELAKVSEVAEDFGAASSFMVDEEQEILNKGLFKYSVDDYINEIAGMYGGVYEGQLGPMANPWV